MADTARQGDSRSRRKVSRLIARYELDGIGQELERRWTATGEEHWSLRDLAEHFNETILRRAMEATDKGAVPGEVENAYRFLTSDEVGEGDRTQIKRRLERSGVDVDQIRSDFVSYQAIRSYLQEVRGVTYSPDGDDQVEKQRENLQRLFGRTEVVTRENITNLRSADRLEIGDFSVIVDVRVSCLDCGEQSTVDELLDSGGCRCSDRP